MAKQDVLDAINATIVENGQKGITAQSLNNVLTMMAENAGEGGSGDGSGVLRILMPSSFFMFGYSRGVTSPSIIVNSTTIEEHITSLVSGGLLDDAEALTSFYEKYKSQNQEVYAKILDEYSNGECTPVVLDFTEGTNPLGFPMGFSIMGTVAVATEPDGTSMLAILLRDSMEMISPDIRNAYLMIDPSGDLLGEEGSMLIYVSGDVYIPADGVTLNNVQETNNMNMIDSFNTNLNIRAYKVTSTGEEQVPVISWIDNTNPIVIYLDGTIIKQAFIDGGSGEVEVTTIGTITTQTA